MIAIGWRQGGVGGAAAMHNLVSSGGEQNPKLYVSNTEAPSENGMNGCKDEVND